MEMKKHITDEKTGTSYTLCGEYYLSYLALPTEEEHYIGVWGAATQTIFEGTQSD